VILQKWQSQISNININPDSVVYQDSAVLAFIVYTLQQDLLTATNNAFLAYAIGDELDNLGADRGTERKTANFATGIIKFGRAELAESDYTIVEGTIIGTQPAGDGTTINFETTEEVVLYGTVSAPEQPTSAVLIDGGSLVDEEYHFKITSVSADGKESESSPVETVTIAEGDANNSISLTWSAVPRAVSYNVYSAIGTGEEDNVILLDNTLTPSYTVTDADTGAETQEPPATNETGNLTIEADIQATVAGSASNVAVNTLTNLINKPTGIEYCVNEASITGGTDEEDDATYRARIKDLLSVNTGKVTVSGYQQTCESVDGVATATVTIPVGGAFSNLIEIYITASSGNGVPSAELLAEVSALVNSDDNRAVCDSITVLPPDTNNIDITVDIVEYDTDYGQADLETTIQTAIEAYLPTLGIGGKLYIVDLENILHDTAGILDFDITLPVANIQLAASEMAILGTLTFNWPV